MASTMPAYPTMRPAIAMPRPCSPVFLIWLSEMCPQITPAMEPMPQRITMPAMEAMSETMASVFVLAAGGWP